MPSRLSFGAALLSVLRVTVNAVASEAVPPGRTSIRMFCLPLPGPDLVVVPIVLVRGLLLVRLTGWQRRRRNASSHQSNLM
jgi:hypothetical protein